ncbi:MAG: hypothetical protein ACTSQY_01730 [Candidatus Odinarchaeia archaeon]
MENRVKEAKTFLDEAGYLYATRKLDEAERELKKALKYYRAARKRKSDYKTEISEILRMIADIYYLRGNHKKADKYYEESYYIYYNY